LLDRWREKSNARPGVIAAIGAAAIAVVVAVVAVTGNGNRTSNCETTGKFIRCSQLRSGG
jgi:hypothetical protein